MESTAMPAGRLPTRPSRLSLLALVTLVIAIAGVGAFLAIGLFQAGAPAQGAPVQEGTYDVRDVLLGQGGDDKIHGGSGADQCGVGAGKNRLRSC